MNEMASSYISASYVA